MHGREDAWVAVWLQTRAGLQEDDLLQRDVWLCLYVPIFNLVK